MLIVVLVVAAVVVNTTTTTTTTVIDPLYLLSFLSYKKKMENVGLFPEFQNYKMEATSCFIFLLACVASVSVWFREQREIFGSFSFSAPK